MLATLKLLSYSNINARLLLIKFLLELLSLCGYGLSFNNCAVCGNVINDVLYIDVVDKFIKCKNCKGEKSFTISVEERNVLNFVDAQMLGNAVSYCNGRFAQLSKHQVKEITRIVEDLKANGIV